jgi:hypothetical protein
MGRKADMKTSSTKMTVDEIRQRYDGEVERFSDLSVGQATTVDATTNLALLAEAAAKCTPNARRILDIGCGAGNAVANITAPKESIAARPGGLARVRMFPCRRKGSLQGAFCHQPLGQSAESPAGRAKNQRVDSGAARRPGPSENVSVPS